MSILCAFGLVVIAACSSRAAAPTQSSPPQAASQPTTAQAQRTTISAQPSPTRIPPTAAKGQATTVAPTTQTPAAKSSPLPSGFNIAVVAPADQGDTVGLFPSLVLNATDDPMVAYIVTDPADKSNTALSFTMWDRASGTWSKPVVVDKVADLFRFSPMLQVARDASNNMIGIVYHKTDTEIWLALSSDNGANWNKEQITTTGEAQVENPSLAMANGSQFAAFVTNSELNYLSRQGTSGAFQKTIVPLLADGGEPWRTQPQVAVDSQGNPAVAFFQYPKEGYNDLVAFWRPGEDKSSKVADSNNHQNDDPHMSMAFDGVKPRLAVTLSRGEEEGGPMYFVYSDDGKTWSSPIHVPQEGNETMGGFLSLAVNASSAAIAAPTTSGNLEASKCGQPKLARSSDLKNWKTCSPDTDASLGLSADNSSLVFDSKGKLYLAFQNTSSSSSVKPGLVVWREP